jgi:hypothetical protein
MPDAEPTLAIAVLLLLQVPPETVLDKVPLPPRQIVELPVMAAGVLITETAATVTQPG